MIPNRLKVNEEYTPQGAWSIYKKIINFFYFVVSSDRLSVAVIDGCFCVTFKVKQKHPPATSTDS